MINKIILNDIYQGFISFVGKHREIILKYYPIHKKRNVSDQILAWNFMIVGFSNNGINFKFQLKQFRYNWPKFIQDEVARIESKYGL